MVKKFLAGALFSFVSLVVSAQAFAQADVIEKRQDAMKGNAANAKAIKAAVESKDYASLFPKGSTAGKTKAKPEIWEKSDDFAKAAKNLNKAAGELAAAAKSGDDAAVGTKVKALGDACASCHKQFRAEKYAE